MFKLDRDLLFEICENLVCNPSSILADLDDDFDADESPLPESKFKHFTLEDGTPAGANPFKVFLVNRACAHSVLDLFRSLPVLSIYSSYGSFEKKNASETGHQPVPLDHPTLQYILRNGECKILELHAWGTVISVLKEIQTNTIQNIRWGFIDEKESQGDFSTKYIMEFERILRENAKYLEILTIDETLIPYVPYEFLRLESFTVPYFNGTLDQAFLRNVNTRLLYLREAANACNIFSHEIYEKGCSPNPYVQHLAIDFSRTLHEEFRKKLNLCELIMELPIRFPNLHSFKFIAEQDALLEDHFNRLICLREFGQAIYNIEEIMEGFEPCPFEFIVDIFCFVPRAALQFMITQIFFGFHETELLPGDTARYVFKRLIKYFGAENNRCLIIRLC